MSKVKGPKGGSEHSRRDAIDRAAGWSSAAWIPMPTYINSPIQLHLPLPKPADFDHCILLYILWLPFSSVNARVFMTFAAVTKAAKDLTKSNVFLPC
eukprot:scaffold21749_cov49-Prasinocladus_malaysianus.AAC.2